ncbi:hypothetical protein DPMN_127763 [Dreissena polymorpha]|uniref:Uncharacterized protein n=1 Tax=Dreissena polymorpha TaxID=45954 RepID=A0A9D4GZI7_DREPO|nr:hypothetical protein DPMN_127763 [Dreissena polymorpha]
MLLHLMPMAWIRALFAVLVDMHLNLLLKVGKQYYAQDERKFISTSTLLLVGIRV